MYQDEPTLTDVLWSIWRARFYVLAGAAAGLVIAAFFMALVTPSYKATMIVAPADGYALGDYAATPRLDRSISVSVPFWRPMDLEGVSTDFYRFVYTSRGTSVAEILLKDDTVIKGINRDSNLFFPPEKWTPAALSEYLDSHIHVEPLGATPLRRISYSHPDPDFAAALLRKIHLVADQMIRRDRRRQSQSRIAYLEQVLDKTSHPDHRKGITNLLMQQEHIQMLANLDEPYAAIVVEPAAASAHPVWPKGWLVWPVFMMIGMGAGYLGNAIRHARPST